MFGAAVCDALWRSQYDKASSICPSAFPTKGGYKVGGCAEARVSLVRGGEHGVHRIISVLHTSSYVAGILKGAFDLLLAPSVVTHR